MFDCIECKQYFTRAEIRKEMKIIKRLIEKRADRKKWRMLSREFNKTYKRLSMKFNERKKQDEN